MVHVDNVARGKLALNEACEQKWVLTDYSMQPLSTFVIGAASLYAFVILFKLIGLESKKGGVSGVVTSLPIHALLAQLGYHASHFYIHMGVDMAHDYQQKFW